MTNPKPDDGQPDAPVAPNAEPDRETLSGPAGLQDQEKGRARSRANLGKGGVEHVRRSREARAEREAAAAEREAAEWLARVEGILAGPGLKRLLAEKLADPKTPPAYIGAIATALTRISESEQSPTLRAVPASVESWMESLVAGLPRCPTCGQPIEAPQETKQADEPPKPTQVNTPLGFIGALREDESAK